MDKNTLRLSLKAWRQTLTPAIITASAAGHLRMCATNGLLDAPGPWHLYASLPGEAETQWLWDELLHREITVLFSRTIPKDHRLEPCQISNAGDLVPGPMKILQPRPGLPAWGGAIGIIIVPGLAFGLRGERLGFGAGYYDRFLAQYPQARRIGLCLDDQIRQDIPMEAHDEPLDALLTPTRFILTGARP